MAAKAPLSVNSNAFILMVDDNEDERVVAQECFAMSGLHNSFQTYPNVDRLLTGLSFVANEGEEAAAIVLVDINMPEKDGFYCLETIRAQVDFHKFFVVMLTNSDNSAHIRRATELGADGYQVKPTDANAYAEFFRGLVA